MDVVKWDWLHKQLASQRASYTQHIPISVFCATWNVNGTPPCPTDALFQPVPGPPPHLVYIGLQEIIMAVDLAVTMGGEVVANRERAWLDEIEAALARKFGSGAYTRVEAVRMSGISLAVWVLSSARAFVDKVSVGQAACGLLGFMGNKGGVAVRLRLHDSWLTVVNCHLAAHQDNVLRRNQDFREIRTRLLLPVPIDTAEPAGSGYDRFRSAYPFSTTNGITVDDCDGLVWMGDLNYRLARHGTGDLLDTDQLSQEREAKRVFPDFDEAPISFPPTYKYAPGGDAFDEAKDRVPSYCDRVLWRATDSCVQACTLYTSVADLRSSDHKPVVALLSVDCAQIVRAHFEQAYEQVLRSMDVWENALIPVTHVVLPRDGCVDFGEARFRQLSSRQFALHNTGRTAAPFSFVAPPASAASLPAWLRASPSSGLLLPGHSVDISLHVWIGPADAYLLNLAPGAQHSPLSCILILRIAGGKDHFVAVDGLFKKTLFARPLHGQMSRTPMASGAVMAHAPVPLERLCEYMVRNRGVEECENLMLASGERALVDRLIECIDDDADFPQECRFGPGMLAVGECVLRWLEALPEPILPAEFIDRTDGVRDGLEAERMVARDLPEDSFIVFDYLMGVFGAMPTANKCVDRVGLCWVLGDALARVSRAKADNLVRFMQFFIK